MGVLSRLKSFVRNIFRRNQAERDLTHELSSYVAQLTDENVARGMTPAEARRAALASAGSIEALKDDVRSARAGALLETLLRDARYGLRMMGRSPVFTAIALVTLVVGIGSTTALFTVVNAVLLKPLPFRQPDQLVGLHASKPNFPTGSISFPNFRDWQQRNRVFSAMAINRGVSFSLRDDAGETERIRGEWTTSDLFRVFGVEPLLGRDFAQGEDDIGAAPVAEISEGLWKRKFGASRDIVGRAITLDGRRYTVISIIPASFDLLQVNFGTPDVYVPLGQSGMGGLKVRGAGLGLHGFGRLREGVSSQQARQDMARVTGQLANEFPIEDRGLGATIIPLQEQLVGNLRGVLWLLLGAVAFVLMIACVNVASLLLARSASRTREFAVRAALGAPRGRMVRQLLTETILLGFAGGALGIGVAAWGTRAALQLLPPTLPRVQHVAIDARVLLVTFAVSLLAGLLFGLAPAQRMAATDPQRALQASGRGGSGRRHRGQRTLVVAEFALALLLLAGTGLMLRSLVQLWRVNPGFNPDNLLLFVVALPPGSSNASPQELRTAWDTVQRDLSAVPGVTAASLRDSSTPFGGDNELLFWEAGQPQPKSDSEKKWALRYDVTADYLRVMQQPLLRGRFFTPQENKSTPLVAVVDDVFANTFYPGQDVIGKRIDWLDNNQPLEAEIVGVVAHVKQWGLEADDQQLRTQVYVNLAQLPDNYLINVLGVSVRTSGNPAAALPAIRRQLRQINGDIVVFNEVTMTERIAQSLQARRFTMVLLGGFACVALLLASVGIFGVVSYLVRERTQEIGVRMALGAQRGTVLAMILREGAQLAGAGLLIGLIVALPAVRAIRSLLYGVKALDPLTFAAVGALLVLVALFASFIPARRATRIDPMEALRYE